MPGSPDRAVTPEWLDALAPADPRAVRSRRDLRRINILMGNARFIAGHLSGRRIVDLGAGDGSLMLSVARRLKRRETELTLVDRALAVPESTLHAFRELGWTPLQAAEDVFSFLRRGVAFDAIVVNLFLHHFDNEALAELLSLAAARAPLFLACEPRRSTLALAASRLLGLLGCNDVTRHDAVASVRAGFHGEELSRIWPRVPGWQLAERALWPFSHAFIAQRDASL